MVRLIIMAICLMLSGCSVFTPVPNAGTTYLINTVPNHVPVKKAHHTTIMVALPDSVAVYNTNEMAYSTSPYQVAYFAKNSWAETPAQMLKPLLIETLVKTHHFRVVTFSETSGTSDYVLHTQILELKQNFAFGCSEVRFKLGAQIVKSSTGEIVAAKMFDVAVPAQWNTPYGGVVAANQATAEMLQKVARFCERAV